MKKLILTIFIVSILLIGIASAEDSAPILPLTLSGTVQNEEGKAIPAGTVITAMVNGETFTYTMSESGKIGEEGTFGDKFIISPSEIPRDPKIIFKIGSVQSTETIDFAVGETKTVSLTFAIEIPATSTQKPSGGGTSTPPSSSVVEIPTQTPIPTATETPKPTVPTNTPVISPEDTPVPSTPAETPLSILSLLAGVYVGVYLIRRK